MQDDFEGTYSNKFLVLTDLRQGDTLSPALLNITFESVMRQDAKVIKIRDTQQLEIIACTDDVVITAENEESLKDLEKNRKDSERNWP